MKEAMAVDNKSHFIFVVPVFAIKLCQHLVQSGGGGTHIVALIRESMLIGCWVAMWRPIEIFLYDWWPIRAERRLFERLSAAPIEIRFKPR